MALQKFTNNATTTIAGGINAAATTLVLSSGTGTLFPGVTPPFYFIGTISKSGTPSIFEIVKVTNRTGDTLTIQRQQEGTAAQTWSIGDNFSLLPTAGGDANFVQIDDYQNSTYVYAGVDTGTASAYAVTLNPSVVQILPGTTFRFKAANTSNATSSTMALTTVSSGTITAPMKVASGGNVGAGQIVQGGVYQVTYDGANFQVTGASGNYYAPIPQETATVSTFLKNLQYPYGDVRRYGAIGDGVTDDTAACQAAANVANAAGFTTNHWQVTFPPGYVFHITGYVQFYSNTSVEVYSTILLNNRSAGFCAVGASNVRFDGHGCGTFTDATVSSNFLWNQSNSPGGPPEAPAIHIRLNCTNCHVRNMWFQFVNAGVFLSVATTNIAPSGEGWTANGNLRPSYCTVQDCWFSMIEQGSATALECNNIAIRNNFAYRTGDGGFWFMGCAFSDMQGNTHLSPRTTPADVATHGRNNISFPTTWNDEQGIEFENCYGVKVTDNFAINMWFVGIDVKNASDEVLVDRNVCVYCECDSIMTRDGDFVKNAVLRCYITNNLILEHGTQQYGNSVVANGYEHGPIVSDVCFAVSITDNIIGSYQDLSTYALPPSGIRGAGIYCNGPGAFLGGEFPTIPQRSRIAVERNILDFMFPGFGATCGYVGFIPPNVINMTSTTPPGIIINGIAADIRVCDNLLKGDVNFNGDGRARGVPAIAVVAVLAPANGPTPILYAPLACKIDNNSITCWGQGGIWYQGNINEQGGCLSVSSNMIASAAYSPFIYVIDANRPVICNNVLNQTSTRGQYSSLPGSNVGQIVAGIVNVGIAVTSSNTGASPSSWSQWPIVNNNSISGAWDINVLGGPPITLGIFFERVNNADAIGNSIGFVQNAIPIGIDSTNNGNVFTYGSTGFPQSGVNLNNAAAQGFTNYYNGELLFSRDSGGNLNGVWMGSISGSGSGSLRRWSQIAFNS